ncbi:uncharacterized protein SAMN05661008_01357 [Alkalithermobacter thermoalcaliphilus JW-YL-7 = DSM 7308]|uniref:TPM domain-containing protein n=1 Tax=Alkalithermobacter thermoalcaliphilus JW-YL-7 = DSM 7308 TaxID=1121328 RepID=A0A150FNA5_CLOPD|nr:protein of unknown function DUF477 [[Clostridium] paradoxum JW-YL-7 = DSM 7308]SHL04861.1 uncharacterized protein SAMN05661008_01357 [[Clostridium] paradoxum JW-YL-7 = DSM 7308]
MRKNKLFIIATVCLIVLLNIITVFSINLPNQTNEFYVADFANILSQDTKKFIINTNLNYEKTKEMPQIVVVTVKSLEGHDTLDYSVKLFEKWKIGNKKYDNGILVLLAPNERKIRVEVGYGLEGALPDGKVGEILDYAKGDLSNANYDEGIRKIFYLLAQNVNKEYGYEDSNIFEKYNNIYSINTSQNDDIGLIPKIIIVFFVFFIFWADHRFAQGFFTGMILRSFLRGGHYKGGPGGSSGKGGSSGGGGAGRDF